MKINEQNSPAKTQPPHKTQPIPLTDESMFDLEELTDEELFGIVGGSTATFGFDFDGDGDENYIKAGFSAGI